MFNNFCCFYSDLFQMYLEKSNKLDQIFKSYKQLKGEVNKVKLENERLSYNHDVVTKANTLLTAEHNEVKSKYSALESEYREVTSDLQIKYQTANLELNECKEKLSQLESEKIEANLVDITPIKPTVRRSKAQTNGMNSKSLVTLASENQILKKSLVEYKNENIKLKLDVYNLKKSSETPFCEENKADILDRRKEDLDETLKVLEEKCKKLEKEKEQEISKMSKELTSLQLAYEKLEIEHEKINNKNCDFQLEISMLQEKLCEKTSSLEENEKLKVKIQECHAEISALNLKLEESNRIPDDVQIQDIMQDMVMPVALSPLDISFYDLEMPGNYTTCAIIAVLLLWCFHINLIFLFISDGKSELKRPVQTSSPLPPKMDIPPIEITPPSPTFKPLKNHRINSPSGSFLVSNYDHLFNKTSIKPYPKTKKIIKRRKIPERIDLMGALVALKKAKINFTISNESISPPKIQSQVMPRPMLYPPKPHTVVANLTCTLSCCKNSYMLLGGAGEEALLGFFDVKTETQVTNEGKIEELKSWIDQSTVICRQKQKTVKRMRRLNSDSGVGSEENWSANRGESPVFHQMQVDLGESGKNNWGEFPETKTGNRESDSSRTVSNLRNLTQTERVESPVFFNKSGESVKETLGEFPATMSDNFESESFCNDLGNLPEDKAGFPTEQNQSSAYAPIRKQMKSKSVKKIKSRLLEALKRVKKIKPITSSDPYKFDSSCERLQPIKHRVAHAVDQSQNCKSEVTASCVSFQKIPLSNTSSANLNQSDSVNDSPVISPKKRRIEIEEVPSKPVKSSFKRPLCKTRQSVTMLAEKETVIDAPVLEKTCNEEVIPSNSIQEAKCEERVCYNLPKKVESVVVCTKTVVNSKENKAVEEEESEIIDKEDKKIAKLQPSRVELLFQNLLNYSSEEKALDEVVEEFVNQNPYYVAQ